MGGEPYIEQTHRGQSLPALESEQHPRNFAGGEVH